MGLTLNLGPDSRVYLRVMTTSAPVGLLVAFATALLRMVAPLISLGTFRDNVVQGTIAFISTLVLEAIVFSIFWRFLRHNQTEFD